MDLFVLDEDVVRFEAALPSLVGRERLSMLVMLAWSLRQRNTRRAVALAEESRALLAVSEVPQRERQVITGRLQLIDGEAQWLFADLPAARALADAALQGFTAADDAIGCVDAHWLLAHVAYDSGNLPIARAEMAAAVAEARRVADAVRTDSSTLAAAIWAGFQQASTARGLAHANLVSGLQASSSPGVAALVSVFGMFSDDYGVAIGSMVKGYDLLRLTGQVDRAVKATGNIAVRFGKLNDHEAALEWVELGLEQARLTGWPMSVGNSLTQTADVLRNLGRFDAAESMLRQGLQVMAGLSNSRVYAIALKHLGDVALARNDFAGALDTFRGLQVRPGALGQIDFHLESLRGQAQALWHLDRPNEALEAATAALHLAVQHNERHYQMEALKVLAAIHEHHPGLPAPQPMAATSAALHYLQRVLEVGATIEGHTVPADVLDAVAHQHAKAGEHAKAYETALRANVARQKTQSIEATNRATAMQVRYQTERAQVEAEHLRNLAASEAKRAEALQQTNTTLERLGTVGQEITGHLDEQAVFEALARNVQGLLAITFFAIYLADADGEGLSMAFGVEAGQALPSRRVELSNLNSDVARCARERREIMVDLAAGAADPNLIPGTLATPSRLFVPLIVGDRMLGVMTIQSVQAQAYGERERLIFRTLCAYGAIALDNATAYRQVGSTLETLRQTQAELVNKSLELERAYQALQEVSVTDSLTGLHNRRFLEQHVQTDIALALRQCETLHRLDGQPRSPDGDLTFFMVDLDHFKAVNDRYGHAAGDRVLMQMRERLRMVFRDSDYLVRWGGEEFLAVARGTDRAGSHALAERIRLAVQERGFELGDGVRLDKTCSIGFASFPFLPEQPRRLSWQQVVELADQALYRAKHAGRNTWVGLIGTERTPTGDLLERMLLNTDQAICDGELGIVTRPD